MVVEVIIGVDGLPVSAIAVDGPPQLIPTAEGYALKWKFQPAMVNGAPVQARFKLTLPFRL